MPLQRVSSGFKDISMSFQINPLSNDLITVTNANAIARSIRNIVSTRPGEKIFNPSFGTDITGLLFETMDATTASAIEDQIRYSIGKFERRVNLTKIEVTPNYDANEFDVVIYYDIIGLDVSTQQLEFILLGNR
ncbi:MAG: hypothetical protein CBD74_07975 [Saprospirales bacterium TMED214]|nr:MAG: hypothetical protein CBD74_07975 [Saprospirales bacterium TMED214]